MKTAGKKILASLISVGYLQEIKDATEKLQRPPKLVGLLANTDPAAKMYAQWTGKTCNEVGVAYELLEVPKETLEEAIYNANNDDSVDGILVYFPVFNNRQDQYLQQCVSLKKDVEGLNFTYISNMYHNIRFLDNEESKKSIVPCTPLLIVKILEYLKVYNPLLNYGDRLYGKTITIVNRSEIVGRPLLALLANDGAVVYSVDVTGVQKFERGDNLMLRHHRVTDIESSIEEVAPISDVIITGVPSKEYKFDTNLLKSGAVCINFSSEKNFKEPEILSKASLYVPMTGKVTIAMLLRNMLRLMLNDGKI